MKNTKQLFKQVGRRFGMMVFLPVVGFLGAVALFVGTLSIWALGFIVIPVGIAQRRLTDKKWTDDPYLPAWAWAWDDSLDIDIRGRPQATFVWNFGLSWGMATFVHLMFYNPLANLRMKVTDFYKAKSGRG